MSTQSFDSAAALAKFVTDSSIPQANVVKVAHVDGRWWLFWYAP